MIVESTNFQMFFLGYAIVNGTFHFANIMGLLLLNEIHLKILDD